MTVFGVPGDWVEIRPGLGALPVGPYFLEYCDGTPIGAWWYWSRDGQYIARPLVGLA